MSEKKEIRRETSKTLLLFTSSLLSVACLSLLFIYVMSIRNEIKELSHIQERQRKENIETNQFLLSTLDWSTSRQKKILFMRDIIVGEWKRCGWEVEMQKAYAIAETNLIESEKYPYLDPFFILAMQWKESSFTDTVVSHMGAIGLNQIMPATARLLCGFFNMQYNERLLYDTKVSTKLAAKLFDVLYAQYNDFELVLAAYNGGPWSAYYYKNGDERLAEETANYVPSVMQKYQEFREMYKIYMVDTALLGSDS